jgi:hypothetical protein
MTKCLAADSAKYTIYSFCILLALYKHYAGPGSTPDSARFSLLSGSLSSGYLRLFSAGKPAGA